MQPAARIAAIAERFRSAGFPDNVVTTIKDYVSGQGTLERWFTGMRVTNDRYHLPADALVGLLASNSTNLDEIDRRLLDVCYATGSEHSFITSIAEDGPAEQVRDYLMEQGEADHRVLTWPLNIRHRVATTGRHPAALERVLQVYIPSHFDELGPLWQTPR